MRREEYDYLRRQASRRFIRLDVGLVGRAYSRALRTLNGAQFPGAHWNHEPVSMIVPADSKMRFYKFLSRNQMTKL
jgi:hypothetical protein